MGSRTQPAGSPSGKELDARIRAFASEMEELIRRATEAGIRVAIANALASGQLVKPSASAPETPAKAKGAKASQTAKAKPEKAPKGPKPPKRKKGQKRSSEELAALVAKLEAFIHDNGGKRIEEIGKALNIATSELAGPVKKLLDGARIRSTGERRATRYYPSKKK